MILMTLSYILTLLLASPPLVFLSLSLIRSFISHFPDQITWTEDLELRGPDERECHSCLSPSDLPHSRWSFLVLFTQNHVFIFFTVEQYSIVYIYHIFIIFSHSVQKEQQPEDVADAANLSGLVLFLQHWKCSLTKSEVFFLNEERILYSLIKAPLLWCQKTFVK